MKKILWIIFAIAVLLLVISGPLKGQDKVTTALLKIRKIEGLKNGKTKVHIGDHATGDEDSGVFYNSTFDENPGWFVNQSLTVVPQEYYKLLIYNNKKYKEQSEILLKVFGGDITNLKLKLLENCIVPDEKTVPAKELKGIW